MKTCFPVQNFTEIMQLAELRPTKRFSIQQLSAILN